MKRSVLCFGFSTKAGTGKLRADAVAAGALIALTGRDVTIGDTITEGMFSICGSLKAISGFGGEVSGFGRDEMGGSFCAASCFLPSPTGDGFGAALAEKLFCKRCMIERKEQKDKLHHCSMRSAEAEAGTTTAGGIR